MSKFQIDIDFSNIDLASLETEEDFQREAKMLLPKALIKLGESVGEKTWEELQEKLQGNGGKLKSSPSEKRRFIQETGRTYQRNASNREKQELEEYIVDQLRQHKR
ncbi:MULTISPECIES: hypothetical protein [unclassified Nostoc]|uniref:hypothetical protein n=1 Tax=unclassified Nostoc TaxID=2593658 RepID=UPI0025AB02AB|nr:MULTISPECIES: hypothetical protein [unclassified Nostoc]MDM9584599.1 hypothetical protein [Nostoc sp. GT001]MDZ7944715.1 hypothetical protein [Nostoc sp. EfeVER01]MDZ7995360.1 hypothetical protein [Nostoc sp. EspVER01]